MRSAPLAPIAVQHTPGSILWRTTSGPRPYFTGRRPRFATCGGVAWFHGLHLATVNLLGNSIHVYRFEPARRTFALLQELRDLLGLVEPEKPIFSPDESLLAVGNSMDGAVLFFGVDPRTHEIGATPLARIQCEPGANPHGLSFTPCGRLFCFSTVNQPSGLRCHDVLRTPDGGLELPERQRLPNLRPPLKCKGVAFPPDGRFVALSYGPNGSDRPTPDRDDGVIAIHRFDLERGFDPDPVFVTDRSLGLSCVEDVTFLPDGSALVFVDQALDLARVVAFDPATGSLGETLAELTEAVSFPHAASVSRDGRYLAIANFGNDTASVYDLSEPGATRRRPLP